MSVVITEKRFQSVNITSGATVGSMSITVASAPAGLQPSSHLWLNGGSVAEDSYVASSYTPGSTTIPLVSAIVNSGHTQVFYDGHNCNGPQSGIMLPFDIEAFVPVLYDAVTNAYIQMQSTNGRQLVLDGADKSTTIAAGTTGDTVVSSVPGRLYGILVFTLGLFAPLVYDHASLAQGKIIGALIASAALGQYEFNNPALNGIVVKGSLTNPGMTIFYT